MKETQTNNVLSAIQVELKAPKNQYNSFSDFKYRSCEDILEGLKPLLKKFECAVKISDEIVQLGARYYVRATCQLLDAKNEIIAENVAYAREPEIKKGMDEAQITGATSSYARKYALNGLFAIDDTKDPDTQNNKAEGKSGAQNNVKKPTAEATAKTAAPAHKIAAAVSTQAAAPKTAAKTPRPATDKITLPPSGQFAREGILAECLSRPDKTGGLLYGLRLQDYKTFFTTRSEQTAQTAESLLNKSVRVKVMGRDKNTYELLEIQPADEQGA